MPGNMQQAVLECGCCGNECCDDHRCVPLIANLQTGLEEPNTACLNPLPVNLTVVVSATPSFGNFTCFDGGGIITYKTPLAPGGGVNAWEGRISGTCINCNGETYNWYLDLRSSCLGVVQVCPSLPCVFEELICGEANLIIASCDPVYISGCIPEQLTACVTACFNPFSAGPTYEICLIIYEEP